MALTEKDYKEASYKLIPKGLAWRNMLSGVFGNLLYGLSKTWAQIDTDANRALDENNPQWSTSMLAEWEDLLNLPECGQLGQTLRERQNSAGYKWHLKGSLSPYFYQEWMRQAFGYDIEIVSYHTHHCLRGCDYPLYTEEHGATSDVYVRIDSEVPYRYLNTQDRVNDALVIGSRSIVECILNKYKPAHIEFNFHYEVKEA